MDIVLVLAFAALCWFVIVRPLLRDLRADAARRQAVQRIQREADESNQTIHHITQSAQAAILRGLVERRHGR